MALEPLELERDADGKNFAFTNLEKVGINGEAVGGEAPFTLLVPTTNTNIYEGDGTSTPAGTLGSQGDFAFNGLNGAPYYKTVAGWAPLVTTVSGDNTQADGLVFTWNTGDTNVASSDLVTSIRFYLRTMGVNFHRWALVY
jgi:hypothetical protein